MRRRHGQRSTHGIRAAVLAVLLGTVAAGAGTAPAAAAAAARGRPNLGVAEVLAVPVEVQSGGRFAVKVLVDNLGTAPARASRVSLHLSRDERRSAGDLAVGGGAVKGIEPLRVRTATGRIEVPASARGSYYVIACADSTRTVAESRERDNCGASRTTVRVVHPVDGLLVGTLDLYDSGSIDTEGWDVVWERYAQAEITMTVRGRGDDIRVVDDGSGYSWVGESTTTVANEECPSTKQEDETMVGLFQYAGQSISDLTGTARDPDVRRLRLSAAMEYDLAGTVTSCGEVVPYAGTTEYVTDLDLEQVSRTDTTITYRVAAAWAGEGEPAQWDTIDGTLELRLS